MPRLLLVTAGIVFLGILYYFSGSINTQYSQILATEKTNPSPALKNQAVEKQEAVINSAHFIDILKQNSCPKNFRETLLNLTETDVRNSLSQLGNFQEDLHWENHHYIQNGIKYVIHLVPNDGESGFEKWNLKVFRDEETGPTFITEKVYNSQQLARTDLQKRLNSSTRKSKKLSWSDGSNLSVQASSAEKIFDIKIQTPNYLLECGPSICRCL